MFAYFPFPAFPTPLTRSWRSILIILIARYVHAHLRERPTSWCDKYHGEAYRELHDSRSTSLASDRFSLALIQQGLPFQRVAHQINTTDVQPTVGNCFAVLVTGLLAVRLLCMHTSSVPQMNSSIRAFSGRRRRQTAHLYSIFYSCVLPGNPGPTLFYVRRRHRHSDSVP